MILDSAGTQENCDCFTFCCGVEALSIDFCFFHMFPRLRNILSIRYLWLPNRPTSTLDLLPLSISLSQSPCLSSTDVGYCFVVGGKRKRDVSSFLISSKNLALNIFPLLKIFSRILSDYIYNFWTTFKILIKFYLFIVRNF